MRGDAVEIETKVQRGDSTVRLHIEGVVDGAFEPFVERIEVTEDEDGAWNGDLTADEYGEVFDEMCLRVSTGTN